MVEEQGYQIVITSTAERAYFEVLDYVFEHHALIRANEIAMELVEHPQILKEFPYMGKTEPNLKQRSENYRFILYERTKQVTVKIIYYVDEQIKTIFLTDFFPCEMYQEKIKHRK
jgi:plasmid stabilization system protein ParE